MPRRREMTLDCLKFEWDPAGTAASARTEVLTRPMAFEIARVLLLLAGARRERQEAHAAAPPTVTAIAGRAGLSEHDARAAIHDLLPTGCVVRQRDRVGRQNADARWARGFELAPRDDIRGPGRRPRLVKLALVIEPSLACGDLLDVLLRRAGVLAVQVTTGEEAVRLLEQIGFDLVVVDSAAAASGPGAGALARAIRGASCDHTLLLRRAGAPADLDHRAIGGQATLAKPFGVREFDDALERLNIGALAALPR